MASNDKEQNGTAIDKLNDNLSSASEKIANNKKVIYWVIGAIVVAAGFVASYFFIYRNPHLKGASEAYNQVELTATTDTVAATEYKKVADQYPNTPAGHLAALEAAEHYYDLGKYKEAIECLDKASIGEKVLKANAYILKGDCYVNLKEYDKALEAFKKGISAGDKNIQIVPRALMKCANIYDEKKEYAKALECYEEIKEDYPTFQLGNVGVDAYIAREQARLSK